MKHACTYCHREKCYSNGIQDCRRRTATETAKERLSLINQLCNCSDKYMHWCFLHNNVTEKHIYSFKKRNKFYFISHSLSPTPLFLPPQVVESRQFN